MKKKSRFLILLLCIPALLFGGLLVSAIQNSAAYYHTIEELQSLENPERMLRVKGRLLPDSVVYDANGPYLEFIMEENGYQLTARGMQAMPDNFLHSDEVIVEGRLDDNHVLQVSKLMLQCPSKYEEQAAE